MVDGENISDNKDEKGFNNKPNNTGVNKKFSADHRSNSVGVRKLKPANSVFERMQHMAMLELEDDDHTLKRPTKNAKEIAKALMNVKASANTVQAPKARNVFGSELLRFQNLKEKAVNAQRDGSSEESDDAKDVELMFQEDQIGGNSN